MFNLFSPDANKDEKDANAIVTPETIKARRAMARMLMEKGMDTSPVQHWLQGAARMGSALNGALEDYYTTKEEKAGMESAKGIGAGLFSGLTGGGVAPGATPSAAPMVLPSSPAKAVADSIPGIDDRYTPEEARKQLALWAGGSNVDLGGLSDKFVVRKAAFLEDNPHEATIGITSGYRSPEKQAAMYANRASNPYPVAPPGKSRHNHGEATDLSFDDPKGQQWSHQNAARYGLAFPHTNDPIHVELAGGRAAKPSAPAQTQVAQAGGGLNPAMLTAAQRVLNHPYASAGDKAVAQGIVQKFLTQETKDPRDGVLKDLTIQEKRQALNGMETQTIDGQLYERPKNSGQPWKLAIESKEKPKFREYNGKIYQENPDGTLQDRTPQGAATGYTPMTPDQRKMFNVPDGTPAFMGPDGKPQFGPASRAEQGEFQKASDKKMAEYFSTHADGGTTAANAMQEIGVLREAAAGAPQGAISGRLASAFPGFSTNADVFNSRVKAIAPQLRVPGSGATSDKDLDTFMDALPRLRNTPEANQVIMDIFENKSKINMQRGEIARQALRGEIDRNEADKKIRELDRQSVLTPQAKAILGIKGDEKAAGNKTKSGISWSVQ